jgi:hypothetical protein
LLVAAGLSVTLVACGGGGGGGEITPPPPPPSPVVTQIAVTPSSASVVVGGTVTLAAQPKDASGNAVAGQTVTWTSADQSKAAVTQAGVVTGVAVGTATITAAVGTVSTPVTITVNPVPVAIVDVTGPTSVEAGQAITLTATPKDANGNALSGRTVAWSSDSPNATVTQTGVVTGVAAGTANITATSEGKSKAVAITVTAKPVDATAPTLTSFAISPATTDVTTGAQTITFTGHVTDAGGSGTASFQVTDITSAATGAHLTGCSTTTIAGGSTSDGDWSCSIVAPRAAANGQWSISVNVTDATGNRHAYTYVDLKNAGFPYYFTLVSAQPDQTAPTFVSFSISPATVDVTNGSQIVTATAHLTDNANGSGVATFSFLAQPPAGSAVSCPAATAPTSGDRYDGVWSCVITVPKGAQVGDWTISVTATDAASNTRALGTPELTSAGYPTKFTVTHQ